MYYIHGVCLLENYRLSVFGNIRVFPEGGTKYASDSRAISSVSISQLSY